MDLLEGTSKVDQIKGALTSWLGLDSPNGEIPLVEEVIQIEEKDDEQMDDTFSGKTVPLRGKTIPPRGKKRPHETEIVSRKKPSHIQTRKSLLNIDPIERSTLVKLKERMEMDRYFNSRIRYLSYFNRHTHNSKISSRSGNYADASIQTVGTPQLSITNKRTPLSDDRRNTNGIFSGEFEYDTTDFADHEQSSVSAGYKPAVSGLQFKGKDQKSADSRADEFIFKGKPSAAPEEVVEPVKKVNESIAPSAGFQFNGAVNGEVTKSTEKPAFSFGDNKPSLRNKESGVNGSLTEKPELSDSKGGFSFGKKSENKIAEPSGFSFGGKIESAGDKPKPPAFSFGGSESKSTKPAFSFGASGESKDATPAKPVEQAEKPAFSLGSTTTENKEKPAFSFGSSTTENKEKPAFSFGSTTTEKEKPAFSFGSTTTENKEKPAFSFGSTTTENKEKPAFSFGSTGSTEKGKPAFSFGSVEAKDKEKPSFSFGSSEQKDKPAFSFGYTATKENKNPSTETKQDKTPQLGVTNDKAAFSFGTTQPPQVEEKKQSEATPKPFTFGNAKPFGGTFGAKPLADGKRSLEEPENSTEKKEKSSSEKPPAFTFGTKESTPFSQPLEKAVSEPFAFNPASTQPNQPAKSEEPSTNKAFSFNGAPSNSAFSFGASQQGSGTSQPNQAFGDSNMGHKQSQSFAFGQQNPSNPGFSFNPSRSASPNFNFTGNQQLDPSSVFGGPAPSPLGQQQPQQAFGTPTVTAPVLAPRRKLAQMRPRRR